MDKNTPPSVVPEPSINYELIGILKKYHIGETYLIKEKDTIGAEIIGKVTIEKIEKFEDSAYLIEGQISFKKNFTYNVKDCYMYIDTRIDGEEIYIILPKKELYVDGIKVILVKDFTGLREKFAPAFRMVKKGMNLFRRETGGKSRRNNKKANSKKLNAKNKKSNNKTKLTRRR
jgi:hypothetical protein